MPERREPRRSELTVGYRIPGPAMDLAAKVLVKAAPDLRPPVAVRTEGDAPLFVDVGDPANRLAKLIEQVTAEAAGSGIGNVAVICPQSVYEEVVVGFEAAGVSIGRAPKDGLDHQITAVPVNLVKGLEVDVAVVVEPSLIVAEEPQGYRSLYVAMTRATKRLVLVHAQPLPDVLAG